MKSQSFKSTRWRCIRHMSTMLSVHIYEDEAGVVQHEASCAACLEEQDRLREELKMYHEMDNRIRDLQNACIKVLSPE